MRDLKFKGQLRERNANLIQVNVWFHPKLPQQLRTISVGQLSVRGYNAHFPRFSGIFPAAREFLGPMREALPEEPKSKRRGCIIASIFIGLLVLLLIAISSGWLGRTSGPKGSRIVPISTSSR